MQWIKKKTIDAIIHEKTVSLLNSNIFVNKQDNFKITSKIEKALKNNPSNKYFFGIDFNILKAENSFIKYEDKDGTIILPGAMIGPKVHIGKNCLINYNTTICHESIIEDHKIQWFWVKGHNENIFNEKADILAKKSIKS